MNRDKTKIWRGGLAGLIEPAKAAAQLEEKREEPRAGLGAATRVMPVERLLAIEHEHEEREHEHAEHERTSVVAGVRAARAQLMRRVAIALLAVTIVALALIESPQSSAPDQATSKGKAPSAPAAEPQHGPPAISPRRAAPLDAIPEAPHPEADRAVAGLERRAVDALAAGDRDAAAQLYAQLAAARPERRVFAAAARILVTANRAQREPW